MMTCKELIHDFLMEYVQGDLGAEARIEFEKHLSVCPSCVRYIDSYRRTVEMTRELGSGADAASLPPPPPPEGLVRAILAVAPKPPHA